MKSRREPHWRRRPEAPHQEVRAVPRPLPPRRRGPLGQPAAWTSVPGLTRSHERGSVNATRRNWKEPSCSRSVSCYRFSRAAVRTPATSCGSWRNRGSKSTRILRSASESPRKRGTWAPLPAGEILVAYIETDDFGTALGLFSQSHDDFDMWFKRRLADVTGIDLNDPPEITLPELLSSYSAVSTAL